MVCAQGAVQRRWYKGCRGAAEDHSGLRQGRHTARRAQAVGTDRPGRCSLMPEEDETLFRILGYDGATQTFTPTAPFMIEPNSVVRKVLSGAGVDADVFYRHMLSQPIPSAPIVDTQELFARCKAAGLHVAVLTADDRDSTLNFLEQQCVKPDGLLCGDDGRGHKPSSEPLLALASDLNVCPASMVMVGDSTHDLNCGKAAGALTVGVLSGVGGHEELRDADVLLGSVAEIDCNMLASWVIGNGTNG